jgi:tRNA(Ile)-lysidine synthase TilS/MesJ
VKEFCNAATSINPWSQVYKLAAGKTRANSIMTTLRKQDGSETTSIQDTMKIMLDYLFAEVREEETLYHKNINKYIEESLNTRDDVGFSRDETKQTIDSFNQRKRQEWTESQAESTKKHLIYSLEYLMLFKPMLKKRVLPQKVKDS